MAGELTIQDLAEETKDKRFIKVAKVLTKKIPPLEDAIFVEGFDLTSHTFGQDAALPSGDFRAINDGIDASKGATKQIVEPIGLYEDRSQVDRYLTKIAPNPLEFRARRDDQHLRGGAVKLGTAFLTGDRASTPKGVTGFQPRRAALGLTAPSGQPIIWDNGDTGDSDTSIWLVQWGEDGVFFTYPKNSKTAGIEEEDLGLQLVAGANTKDMVAYVTEFTYNYGICVANPRSLVRVCNIGTDGENGVDIDVLIKAILNMRDQGEGAVIYLNTTSYAQFEIAAKNMGEHVLRWIKVNDTWVQMFKNAKVKIWESIPDTETTVAA